MKQAWALVSPQFPSYISVKMNWYKVDTLDQYQYLGNCPPTPPLTQQQSIDNK